MLKNAFCLEVTGKMLSSYKHPERLATQLSALAVHRRWLGKLRHSGTEDCPIRQHGMTSHRHDRQRGIVSEYSWMNEWFVSSVNMSCHLPPNSIPALRFPLQHECSVSVSVKGKPAYFVSMADKKKKKKAVALPVWWLTQTVTDCGFCHISWIYLEAAAHFTQQVLPIL